MVMKKKWEVTCNYCNTEWEVSLEEKDLVKIKCPNCGRNSLLSAIRKDKHVEIVR